MIYNIFFFKFLTYCEISSLNLSNVYLYETALLHERQSHTWKRIHNLYTTPAWLLQTSTVTLPFSIRIEQGFSCKKPLRFGAPGLMLESNLSLFPPPALCLYSKLTQQHAAFANTAIWVVVCSGEAHNLSAARVAVFSWRKSFCGIL